MVVLLRALAHLVLPLVDDPVDRNVALIHLCKCNHAAVGRPPEPVVAIHFLGCDVLGQAPGNPFHSGALRQCSGRTTRRVDDPQVAVPHQRDLRAVRGKPGVLGAVDHLAKAQRVLNVHPVG